MALWLALALLLQIEVLHFLRWHGAQLSLVLVVVVWYAIGSEPRTAALIGLAAGACEDLLGAQTGGAWTISTTLTALAASLAARGFFTDSVALTAGIAAACTLLRRLLFWIVMSLQGYPAGFASLHFHQALWEAAINTAFVIAFMAALRLRAASRR